MSGIWHIVTSKYPPSRGGIGFHSAHLAAGLSSKGHRVHIWTAKGKPVVKDDKAEGKEIDLAREPTTGVVVHRVVESWDDGNFDKIYNSICSHGGKVLLQYRPETFGDFWSYPACRFAVKINKKIGLRVIIHEPLAIPAFRFFRPKTWLASFHQYFCLRKIVKNATNVYVTTNSWKRYLKPFALSKPVLTLPVPSNIQKIAEQQKARNLRKAFGSEAKVLLGTYSSFKEVEVLETLELVVISLLRRHSKWVWLALGRYSESLAQSLHEKYPELANRIKVGGELDNQALSAHLQACDIIFQPFYQGVSTRRTSVMAALFHAMPTVTSYGVRTEDIWRETGCVELVKWDNVGDYVIVIEKLVNAENIKRELSQAARLAYETCFSLEHNVRLIDS